MKCPHCKGTGLDRETDRCIPPNRYNCRYCGGSGLLKDAIIQHLLDNSLATDGGLVLMEKDFEKVADILIDETLSLFEEELIDK